MTARCRAAWAFAGLGIGAGCGEPGRPPAAVVAAVEDLGPLPTHPGIGGRDGGYSGLAFGRSMWLYGDTILLQPDAQGTTWHHSSFSWTEDTDAADGLTGFAERTDSAGAPVTLLSLRDEERAFNDAHANTDEAKLILWPAGLVADEARARVLVFYSKVLTYPGPFNFAAVGTSIAVWDDWAQAPVRAAAYSGDEPTLLFHGGRPLLAEGAVVHDQHLYAYDCRGTDQACVVGRAPLADALARDAWRYWDGTTWHADWTRAHAVMEAHDIVSVHFNDALDAFVALYSHPLSNRVEYRTAPEPQGPWSRATEAFSAMPPADGAVSYSALAHAELTRGSVEYVTYHRGTAPFRSEIRLVEVEFAVSEP